MNNNTTKLISDLRDAAGKATQGERTYTSIGTIEVPEDYQICEDVHGNDADFFVLCSPPNLTLILDELARVKNDRDACVAWLERVPCGGYRDRVDEFLKGLQ